MNKVLEQLIAHRVEAGITQEDLAKKLGCSQSWVSKIENSPWEEITIGELKRYADALGCSVSFDIDVEDKEVQDLIELWLKEEDNKENQVRELIEGWLKEQGHERCWYYPDIFEKIAEILGIKVLLDTKLPPLCEFQEGCKKYQQSQYPETT